LTIRRLTIIIPLIVRYLTVRVLTFYYFRKRLNFFMEPHKTLLYEIRVLDLTVQRKIESNAREHMYTGVSAVQMMILDYLTRRRGEDIYQRDIADRFAIRSSSVTAVLQKMERAGYIVRESVENDARLKRISVTDRGEAVSLSCRRDMNALEDEARNILSEQEIQNFFSIAEKLIQSMKQGGTDDQETC